MIGSDEMNPEAELGGTISEDKAASALDKIDSATPVIDGIKSDGRTAVNVGGRVTGNSEGNSADDSGIKLESDDKSTGRRDRSDGRVAPGVDMIDSITPVTDGITFDGRPAPAEDRIDSIAPDGRPAPALDRIDSIAPVGRGPAERALDKADSTGERALDKADSIAPDGRAASALDKKDSIAPVGRALDKADSIAPGERALDNAD